MGLYKGFGLVLRLCFFLGIVVRVQLQRNYDGARFEDILL